MTKQDADVLEVLIGQMAERRDINAVLSKALRVLGHAELFEPVRNRCIASPPCDEPYGVTNDDIRPRLRRELAR